MVSFNSKAVCIVDDHNKIVYINDVYQEMFNDEKIGQETTLWSNLKKLQEQIYYHPVQKQQFKIIEENFVFNDTTGRIYTIEKIDIKSAESILDTTLYDELVEINVTRDTYTVLFYQKDKYIISSLSGNFSSELRQIAQTIIHPKDQNEFLHFFENIKKSYKNFKPIFGKFRRLLKDGQYGWVNGILIAVSNGHFNDVVYMCFFQDVERAGVNIESSIYNEYDSITGLLNSQSFLKTARSLLEEKGNNNYCLIAIDIEHFKLFNDWYGRKIGNELLGKIGLELRKAQDEFNTAAGYFGGDDFVIIMPNDYKMIDQLLNKLIAHIKKVTVNPGFFPKFGIYTVVEGEYIAPMYDRALMALSSIKGNYTKQIAYYDAGIKEDFEYSQSILMDTQQALTNHEFMVYFQPKCNMLTGKIVGAEALVRWNHPTKGIIAPGSFVFILEKNGFIVNLDLFVWQETCRLLNSWLINGNRSVPISVNVSRTDIYALDVVKTFKDLIKKYELPANLIEIEITESSYASDCEIISKVVDDFRQAGFTVLMDDFGSGYSSLNMLKDVNVDILKIDMKFLELREDTIGRGVGILEAIVKMAKLMGLRVIAEGVETKQQIDLLNEMGCIYGQGYYFYSPLPADEYEKAISNIEAVDFRGIMLKEVDQIRLKDIFINDISSEAMLNNILGGIAFYQVSLQKISIIKVNDIFYHITKANPTDFKNIQDKIINFVHPDDQKSFVALFEQAYQNPINGSEATIRYCAANGEILWINLRVFFLRRQDESKIFYGSINDVTKNNLQEQELVASKQTISQLLDLPDDHLIKDHLDQQNSQTAVTMFSKVVPTGIFGCYRTREMPIYFINREMLSLLNCKTIEEFNEFSKGRIINIIHPDDHERVYQAIGLEEDEGFEYIVRYRLMKKE